MSKPFGSSMLMSKQGSRCSALQRENYGVHSANSIVAVEADAHRQETAQTRHSSLSRNGRSHVFSGLSWLPSNA
jgi:hypothetical protein